MKKHFALLLCLFLVSSLFLTSCAKKQKEEETIKIGAILPLTGAAANLGQGSLNAINMAIEEINSQGGVNRRKIQLIIEDGMCEGKSATNAANKLVNIDKVRVVIGGICSGETIPASYITEPAKVILFSPCSSSPKITEIGDYLFRVYPSDSFQGKFDAEFAYNTLGKRKVGILYDNSDWGIGVAETFKKRFEELGGKVAVYESYHKSDKDMRTQLTKAKNAGVDLLYTPSYTQGQILLIKQAKELDINVPIMNGDGAYDPLVIKETGALAEGFMCTLQKTDTSKEWKEKYEKRYQQSIPLCASHAYDSLKIIAEALKVCEEDTECLKNYFYNMPAYNGISGTIKFDKNGDVENALYRIVIVKNGKFLDYETGEEV